MPLKHIIPTIFLLLITFINYSYSNDTIFFKAKPKSGDGIENLLIRYELGNDIDYKNKFIDLNRKKLGKSESLYLEQDYLLPILVYKYNSKSIRNSLDIDDLDLAKQIEAYNIRLEKKKLTKSGFKKSKTLLVPYFMITRIIRNTSNSPKSDTINANNLQIKDTTYKKGQFEIFGKKYQDVKVTSNLLKGCIIYLSSGHGGPDPGAIGKSGKKELHEDEYAYDITLRLGRKLIENGADVYFLVIDPDDGIRDDAYLNNDSHEYYFGEDTIDVDQSIRLKKRAEIVNNLYDKHEKTASMQLALMIHVDSRSSGKRIDVFFYYNPGSKEGKSAANTLQSMIESKYDKAQPGRGYKGTVSERSLLELRETKPTAVYVELGNIQNDADQKRFTIVNNRQALANWLCEGLMKYYQENK